MKIHLKKLVLFMIILCFFTPEGLVTIGDFDYIQNAVLLNKLYINKIVTMMFWLRNLVGLFFCVKYIFQIIANRKFRFNNFCVSQWFLPFSIWMIICAIYNLKNIYEVMVHIVVCFGYILLCEQIIKNNKIQLWRIIYYVLKISLIINAVLIMLYPMGITTSQDYLLTPYYFLGLKNQTTPILLLFYLVSILEFNFTKKNITYYINVLIVIMNVFMMKSGTGILCVLIMFISSMIWMLNILGSFNNKKNVIIVLLVSFLFSIGIVMFDFQKAFEWLIVDILNKDLTLSARTTTWDIAINQFLEKPILGYGYGHIVMLHYYSHNMILELLLTSGIIGFILYIRIAIKSIKTYLDNVNKLNVVLLGTTIAYIIANTGEAFILNISQLTFIVLIANNFGERKISDN